MAKTDEDRYPTLSATLKRIISDTSLADQPVERIEINLFSSGDATYRCWAPKAEEPEGGFLGSGTR